MTDTRDKRGSAIGVGVLTILPLADGAIDQGDRQQTINTYRGILAVESVLWTVRPKETTNWTEQADETTIWTERPKETTTWT